MGETSFEETRLHVNQRTPEEECYARLHQLTDGIPELRTLQAVAVLLEALYAVRGWPLPDARAGPAGCSTDRTAS